MYLKASSLCHVHDILQQVRYNQGIVLFVLHNPTLLFRTVVLVHHYPLALCLAHYVVGGIFNRLAGNDCGLLWRWRRYLHRLSRL